MIVMKFGGSSVGQADRILAIGEIVRERLERRPVVVVSALAGVTDLLAQAIDAAGRGDLEALDPVLADLERRHRWALSGSIDSAAGRHQLSLEIDGQFEELRQKLRSIRILGELTPRAIDALMAQGELLSTRIVAAAFSGLGLPARCVDAREVLITDDRFGAAVPQLAAVARRGESLLRPMLDEGLLPVVGGFVGSTSDGETTTLGRGGSDISAAVIGSAMAAEEIQVWTDVDGLMSADPRLVPAARTLDRVSFAEAAELAFYGARVLHPASVAPAVLRNIPLRVLNSLRPEGRGTVVHGDEPEPGNASLVSVASRDGLSTIRVGGRRLRMDPGFLPSVLGAMERLDLAPDMVVSSEVAVCLAVPGAVDRESLVRELGEEVRVEVEPRRAIVCVVGSGLADSADCRAGVLAALAKWEPELVALGASRISVAAVLPQARLADAVRALHRRFFEVERAV